MEQIKIKEAKQAELEDDYKCLGKDVFNDDIFRHITCELGLFNKRAVEMDYLFIMKDNNRIGFGTLIYKDKRKFFEFNYEKQFSNIPRSCYMKNCYIKKDFRGQGYFRLLLNDFEKRAISRNLNKILLTVDIKNSNSIKIFKHLGFSIVKNIYTDEKCLIVMQKELLT